MKKILVIDDATEMASLVGATLDCHGFKALVAFDGQSGVELACQELPDLILCDVNMPEVDGYATLQALRENESTATIPFVFLSGLTDRLDVRRGMELGADDYLPKPFTPDELMAAVRAQLAKKEEQGRQTEKRLDEVRGNLTLALPHELRTPLAGMLGLASILIDEHATIQPAEILSTAQDIHRSAERLQRLIENFLIYAQLELLQDGASELRAQAAAASTSAEAVVPEAARQEAKLASRVGDLYCDVVPCLVPVEPENLRKIVAELTSNAFKFSTFGSPVYVKTTVQDRTFALSVTDYGRGLTPEQIARIGPHIQFDRRIHEQQGAGLGLTIARRLTELQGGEWSIASVPGRQTTICVRFALSQNGAPPPSA